MLYWKIQSTFAHNICLYICYTQSADSKFTLMQLRTYRVNNLDGSCWVWWGYNYFKSNIKTDNNNCNNSKLFNSWKDLYYRLLIYCCHIWYDSAHSTTNKLIKLRSVLHSRTTPHKSPLRSSYGVSFVSYTKKNDRDILRVHCIGRPILCDILVQDDFRRNVQYCDSSTASRRISCFCWLILAGTLCIHLG